jgi:hypothetical protein
VARVVDFRRDADHDALLALRSLREYWLMPLVTTRPGSDAAATTVPPGHMQKLYTARPLEAWCTSL